MDQKRLDELNKAIANYPYKEYETWEYSAMSRLKAHSPNMSDEELEERLEIQRQWRKLAEDFNNRNKENK